MPDKPRFVQRHRTFWFWMRLLGFLLIAAAAAYSTSQTYATVDQVSRLAQDNVRLSHESARTLELLQLGLIESCQVNGNPLRAAEREDLKEGITDPHDPRLKELLPNVPQDVINRIAKEGNDRKLKRLRSIQKVDCAAQYQSPRGSRAGVDSAP